MSDETFLERLCQGVGTHDHFIRYSTCVYIKCPCYYTISHQTTDYEGRKTLARNVSSTVLDVVLYNWKFSNVKSQLSLYIAMFLTE